MIKSITIKFNDGREVLITMREDQANYATSGSVVVSDPSIRAITTEICNLAEKHNGERMR